MKHLFPLDGSVEIGYTRGGSVVVDGRVYFGRYSVEAGHKNCNPTGLCIVMQ